ncbi:MAG TPA: BrnA antitoxin family protein [Methylomirabilota bacterium]|nr:BrnA antitoxin family protein [Methylomirabilota bacterium]
MSKTSGSSRRGRQTAKSGRRTRPRGIDFSDLPESSDEQLRAMHRVGRPPLGSVARQLIAIRIDPHVLVALQREANRRGVGYQTLIHQLLAKYVARRRSA